MEGWLKDLGVQGLEDVELADFSNTGRGLKTLRSFKEGDKIFTIPNCALWTVKNAHSDQIFGPTLLSMRPPLSVDDTLAIYILFVRSRTSGYDGRRSHIAALPTSYGSSIFFNQDELEVCTGSSLFATTHHLVRQIEADYQNIAVRLLEQHEDLFPRDKFTIDDYKWALCTIWSRAMDFKLHDGNSVRVLAPFADMLNHSSQVRQCHTYDPVSGDLSILAGKTYGVGDQVFINYGPVPNNRLLRLYGFVMPGNPSDCYDLVLSTHPGAPLFEQKHGFWMSAGLDSTCTISLTLADPLPNSVLQYLRIQRMNVSDIALMVQGDAAQDKISYENEVEILRSLIASVSDLLDGFKPQLEELENLLAKDFYAPAGNSWMAAHVSVGEQRVLRSTMKRARTLLATAENENRPKGSSLPTPARCAKCRKTPSRLMRCGRCNFTTYCGRDCQVAHYKEHKVVCQAIARGNDSGNGS